MVKQNTAPKTFTVGKTTYQVNEGMARDEDGDIVAVWVPEVGRMMAVSRKQPRVEMAVEKAEVKSFGGKDFAFIRERDPNSGEVQVRIQGVYLNADGKYEKKNGNEAATIKIGQTVFGLGRAPHVMSPTEAKDYISSLQRLL